MKPRFIALLLLLTGVVAATAWRIATPRQSAGTTLEAVDMRPAPLFQLLDQHDRPTQLTGYLNRFRIVLVFFNANSGPTADPVLKTLKEFHPALKRAGIMVFAISSPLNPEHKQSAQSFPFPVLRDTLAGQPNSCCRLWGRATAEVGVNRPAPIRPATFLIEADGMVRWNGDVPQPVDDPELMIANLISGR